jgi:hypothetical protein
VLATDRRRRLETVRVSLLVRSRGNQFRLRDEFPLRLYTAAQLRRLLAKVPSLELAEVFDFWYEIDRPLKLDDEISDTVLVLRKKGGTQDHEEVRSRKRRRVSAGRDRLLHGLTIEG